jgi:hypothetical protein
MIRKYLPALAALALLPALSAAGSADAGTSAATAVAAGTVTSPTGTVIAGATVQLYAWPSDATVSKLKPGSLVPEKLLATTTTNTAGAYTLNVLTASLEAAATEDGWANLEIDSPAGIWFLAYPAGTLPAHPPATATVNFGGTEKKPKPWPCGYQESGSQDPYGLTRWTYLRPRAPAGAIVGQGYIVHSKYDKGDWTNFSYDQYTNHAQESSLGVGLSAFGLNVGYTTSGTHASTVHRGFVLPNQTDTTLYHTKFTTGEFRAECIGRPYEQVPRVKQASPCPAKDGVAYVHMCLWEVQSQGWAGGASLQHNHAPAPKTPRKYCYHYPPGALFDSDFGKAIEWASGFQLGVDLKIKALGGNASFNTSAQTGYDQNATMDFKMYGGWLCGTNGPNSTAAVLVVRGTDS